jgi:hypothetical protein
MNREQIEVGYIDIPAEYSKLTPKQKKAMCNSLIETLLISLDNELDPTINRMKFLDDVLESSIISNNEYELYEVSQVLYEMRKIINFGKGD